MLDCSGMSHTSAIPVSSIATTCVVALCLQGRASNWQDHLSLTAVAGAGAGGGAAATAPGAAGGAPAVADTGTADALAAAEVARVFEGRLADALLADDGSLSLTTLASNTFSSLLPKIETQGQLGRARYTIV